MRPKFERLHTSRPLAIGQDVQLKSWPADYGRLAYCVNGVAVDAEDLRRVFIPNPKGLVEPGAIVQYGDEFGVVQGDTPGAQTVRWDVDGEFDDIAVGMDGTIAVRMGGEWTEVEVLPPLLDLHPA